jgi:DNA (cytosine-5)-methyltransferase 1
MRHGSLFSGIGGFDMAAQWMGWNNVFHCEWNEFGRKVLKYYWPNAISYGDITKTDFSIHRGRIDILTGGFPCQPFSQTGKREGTNDNRHLWPRMLEVIKQIEPVWVVGENVYGIVNWNGGLVFEQVCTDLELQGYVVQPIILPACAVDAPHSRDRVWFIAYSNNKRLEREHTKVCTKQRKVEKSIKTFSELQNRFQEAYRISESDVVSNNDGVSTAMDGITVSEWRRESIKAYGNAIVPGVALQIFKVIEQFELLETTKG